MQRLIPFSPDIYVGIFERYNETVWPAQLVALALGCVLIVALRRGGAVGGRIAAAILAAFWIWTGYAFHIERYADLNWAALPFGALFILQGLMLGLIGAAFGRLRMDPARGAAGTVAMAMLIAAAAVHPLLLALAGADAAYYHAFGLTPMPVAVATLGVLCLASGRAFLGFGAFPLIWAVWSGAEAWTIGLWPDMALPAIAVLGALAGRMLRGRT